jgi:hypothetical protein
MHCNSLTNKSAFYEVEKDADTGIIRHGNSRSDPDNSFKPEQVQKKMNARRNQLCKSNNPMECMLLEKVSEFSLASARCRAKNFEKRCEKLHPGRGGYVTNYQ